MGLNTLSADKAPNGDLTATVGLGPFAALVIGSAGVVYGDIGTSPLYAFREAVTSAQHAGLDSRASVLGVLSLILWALMLIVTGKYVLLLLRADNKGEGGTFALMSLVQSAAGRNAPLVLGLGMVGASFFYGDSVITPAISVLSAVEGLKLLAPGLEVAVLPIALFILVGLFAAQPFGTAKVAALFGPIMLVWFLVLGLGGLVHIVDDPHVFYALNPWYGIRFLAVNGLAGVWTLGFVFLAVTGAEALYADLGHFGRRPIQTAWLSIVLPALTLNYLGQGALVLAQPDALKDSFYHLYPGWALVPMLLLATFATVIASQAVITGTFSLTRQAIQLGLLPRFNIHHTSATMSGQIYIPRVNWFLMVAVVVVTVLFRSSTNLAAAYGVAVTADMIISSLLTFFLLWRLWKWPLWKALSIIVPLVIIEQIFFAANAIKLVEGAWLPLVMAAIVATIMITWVRGSQGADKGHPAQRDRPQLALQQAGSEPAAPRARHRDLPHLDQHARADLPDAQPQAQPGAARAQHHPHHPHQGRAARAAPGARRGEADGRHVHAGHRALRFHGNAERPQDPRSLPAQGLADRRRRHVVLPVPEVAARRCQERHAEMAEAAVHLARRRGRRRHVLFPDPARPRHRDRHPGRDLSVLGARPPAGFRQARTPPSATGAARPPPAQPRLLAFNSLNLPDNSDSRASQAGSGL